MNRVLMMDDQYWSIYWICSQYNARFVISITENPRVLISARIHNEDHRKTPMRTFAAIEQKNNKIDNLCQKSIITNQLLNEIDHTCDIK